MNQLEAQKLLNCVFKPQLRLSLVVILPGWGVWLSANLFSHAEWQKPKDKLAAGTTNTPFQLGDSTNMRSKRTPKAYAHHINWGFSTGGQRWPWDKVLYKRSVGPGLPRPIKALRVLIVINFTIRSVGTSLWICPPLMFLLIFPSTTPLLRTPMDETSFCCGSSCILLSLSRVLCLTRACCTHRKAGGLHQSWGEMDSTTVD